MSKYFAGIDIAKGDDYSAFVVCRRPRWYERLARRIGLSKATWEWKVVDERNEPPENN